MKHIDTLIHDLKHGISATYYPTTGNVQTRKKLIRELDRKSADMHEAANRLTQARLVIRNLVSDAPTFGHQQAAMEWLEREGVTP